MKIKIVALILLIAGGVFAQQALDKIVAVVDNEIILQSELEFQVGIFASQTNRSQYPWFKRSIIKHDD